MLAALAALLAAPGRASAHPTLLFTTPAADTAQPTPPTTIALIFGEPVTVGEHALAVLDAAGKPVGVDQVATAKEGRAVTGHLTQTLPAGVYTVRWRVTGVDGDLVEGQFRFGVGAAITTTAGAPPGTGIAWPPAGLRWVLFAGLALALGGVVGDRLVRRARAINPALPAVGSWVGVGALVGLVAAAGLGALLAADASDAGVLLRTIPGQVAVVEAAGCAAAVLAVAVRRTNWAAVPLVVVAVADAVRAHANVAHPGWGALLTTVHVTAGAVWVGALVHVVRAGIAWQASPAALRWLVTGYARLAAWLFATVVATGTITALLLVPPAALLTTTYGRVLSVKLALVATAAGLALTARLRLRHPGRLGAVAVATRLEAGALVAVLAATGVLTATPPVRAEGPTQPAPPAPTGVVLPLGTLAGQVGVGVAASDRQLVVRLAAPSRSDYYAAPTKQTFALTGRLAPAGGTPHDLTFRGCGDGCYLARVAWGTGDNVLTLRATATSWRGGTTSLILPWPVQPAPQQLTRAVQAMRRVGEFTLYETVSSDTATAPPDPTPIQLTGPAFLTLEPYGSGVAPQVVQLPTTTAGATGQVRLALGFPAEARYVQLSLDDTGRITDEIQVDPKHLSRRHFTYRD